MSKKLSYRGTLAIGTEDRIRLSTMNGKTGYKINKFQIISTLPGSTDYEYVAQIFKKSQVGSISPAIDLSNSEILAVSYYKGKLSANEPASTDTIIIDNEKFNQDIFVSVDDAGSGTTPCNYYIELESMPITDLEATMLTLKSIKTIKA